jgi:hypothetical protein
MIVSPIVSFTAIDMPNPNFNLFVDFQYIIVLAEHTGKLEGTTWVVGSLAG